jgi:hypothetical protein
MLQAHSFLWHYLWIAPNVLLLVLGFVAWKRGMAKQLPAFLAFTFLSAICELVVYTADVMPSHFVSEGMFWKIAWASLLVESVLKIALVGEIFAHVLGSYTSVARLGKILIRAVGGALILVATLVISFAPQDGRFGIVSGAHMLDQAIYLVESGILLFTFLLTSYFRLSWPREVFGVALGLSISACLHLATWAVLANAGLPDSSRVLLVFLNMATYHVCVLIWFYYLLAPEKVVAKTAVSLPENNLAIWNRELERLIHQ